MQLAGQVKIGVFPENLKNRTAFPTVNLPLPPYNDHLPAVQFSFVYSPLTTGVFSAFTDS